MTVSIAREERVPWSAPRLRALARRLVINFAFAPLAFLLLRPHVGSDATALAIAGAIPTGWTIAALVARRRFDPVGALAAAGFGTALIVSMLTGGSSLPLKLR